MAVVDSVLLRGRAADLLAAIHQDDGARTRAVGMLESIREARKISVARIAEIAALRAALAEALDLLVEGCDGTTPEHCRCARAAELRKQVQP